MKKSLLLIIPLLGIMLLQSCSKDGDDITLTSPAEVTLKLGETHQIVAMSSTPITYTSENQYHSIVSNDGLVTAGFVGSTKIKVNSSGISKDIKIIVKPEYTLYETPSIEWGKPKSEIIAKYGTPDKTSDTSIGYTDYSNSAKMLMFLFDEQNKLKASSVMVKTSYSSDLGAFLAERYLFISNVEDILLLINDLTASKATTIIGAELYSTSYWQVLYMPTPKDNRSSSKNIEIEFDNLFNKLSN